MVFNQQKHMSWGGGVLLHQPYNAIPSGSPKQVSMQDPASSK